MQQQPRPRLLGKLRSRLSAFDVKTPAGLPHGQPLPTMCGPLPKAVAGKPPMARNIVDGQIMEFLPGSAARRFLLRCLEKFKGEWHLIAAAHNLLKLHRLEKQRCNRSAQHRFAVFCFSMPLSCSEVPNWVGHNYDFVDSPKQPGTTNHLIPPAHNECLSVMGTSERMLLQY